jgi:ankyrin repeat protein
MSDLENLIEAVKQGNLEPVRSILESDPRLANQKDKSGATPLHFATLHGHRPIVELLLERGANINSTDSQFGATPAGWAIEYLRFPSLRKASDTRGMPFQKLAQESANREIAGLFDAEDLP